MAKTPIFVVGSIRSGTTYISNILASSKEIASVLHEAHFGIHESSYFTHIYGRYGDINRWSHYVEFIEATINSDYFRITGIERKELYNLYPSSYENVFRYVMDRLAEKNNANYWLEKSPNHALKLDLISRSYADAKFIAIKRDLKDVVKSAMGLRFKYVPERKSNKKERIKTLKRIVKAYYKTYKSIDKFSRRNNNKILLIQFSNLIKNKEQTLDAVKGFLKLESKLEYTNTFKKNTSFDGKETNTQFFNKKELQKLKFYKFYYSLLPLMYFTWKDILRQYVMSKFSFFKQNRLPSWYYKTYKFTKE